MLARIVLRYRFDGGWFKTLLWGATGGLFCLGVAFIIRFSRVVLDDEVRETRPERVTRTVRSGKRTRTVSETVNRTSTVTKTSLEAAEVPTLFINAAASGSQITLMSAPYRSVGRQATTAMNALLRQPRVTLDEKATDYLRSVLPGPWRLGL